MPPKPSVPRASVCPPILKKIKERCNEGQHDLRVISAMLMARFLVHATPEVRKEHMEEILQNRPWWLRKFWRYYKDAADGHLSDIDDQVMLAARFHAESNFIGPLQRPRLDFCPRPLIAIDTAGVLHLCD